MCHRNRILAAALAAIPLAGSAATLCVNPGGTSGCFPTIAGALAAAAPAGDTINVAAGTYSEGGLVITKSVNVAGAGADVTVVDATGVNDAVFRYPFFVYATSTLSHMTIQHGIRGVDLGGQNVVTLDHVHVTNNGPATGAGVFNGTSTLYMDSSLVDHNSATDPGSIAGCDWGGASGGGIASLCGGGSNYITNSTIANNTSGRWGAGILVNDGTTTIENSTITGNVAQSTIPGLGGSALFVGGAFPVVTVRYTTIANNDASASGTGGALQVDSHVQVFASLAQHNAGGDCASGATPVSLGYNLGSDSSCPFIAMGDGLNVDAKLKPLANNGGDTPTMALPVTSPAVDLIPAAQCAETRDQDDVTRPQHGACDVGAFEYVWSTKDLVALLLSQLTGAPETAPFVNKFSTILALVLGQHPRLACQVLPNFASQIQNLAAHGKIPADRAAAIAQTVKDIEASVGC
jgi:hypothetical protein